MGSLVGPGLLLISLVASSVGLRLWLRRHADPRIIRSLDQLPRDLRIVVLGCKPRLAAGRLNRYFIGRVASAAAAYHHGGDRPIVCSGRIHEGMNEVTELADALVLASVPRDAISLDSESMRTIDSIDYVAKNHPDEPILFVTQSFHLPRTLFLARRRGVDGWGLLARGPEPGWRGRLRERLAEARAVVDVVLRPQRN